MYTWTETLLRVDLTAGEVTKESISRDILVNYIGGEGLGARLLYDEVPPGTDPFSPEMAFIVAAGPLSGTLAPGSGRLEIVSKSPITGIFGDSNAGDDFAPELHWAGYIAILIRGRAEHPVYLWIDDDDVQIKDGRHLWGCPHAEAIDIVKGELGDSEVRTIAVGPAAEKGVLVTAVYSGYSSAAGWPGVGSVMASKNLKLVAVRGTRGVQISDPVGFEQACREATDKMTSGTIKRLSRVCVGSALESTTGARTSRAPILPSSVRTPTARPPSTRIFEIPVRRQIVPPAASTASASLSEIACPPPRG